MNIRGWIFYDAKCLLCVESMRRVRRLFEARGFCWHPLQLPGSAGLLGVTDSVFETRMHVLMSSGRVFHNGDAFGVLCRAVWWLWPLGALLLLPGFRGLGRLAYDWLARNRYCLGGQCEVRTTRQTKAMAADWLPAVVMLALTVLLIRHFEGWVFMWALAFAMYAGCKWATYRHAMRSGIRPATRRKLGYLLAWPGMDARTFLESLQEPGFPQRGHEPQGASCRTSASWTAAALRRFCHNGASGCEDPTRFADRQDACPTMRFMERSKRAKVATGTLGWGLLNLICGVGFVWIAGPPLINSRPLVAGWMGMIGLVLTLHFGLFAILAWVWQKAGVAATPIMRTPLTATSLAEFWGRRWNTGFHQLADAYVFRPVARRADARVAVMMVFIISGVIHDLLISWPARGGYGLPTLYFALQGLGVLFERTDIARELGLGSGVPGWLFTMTVTASPAFLLFHPPFVQNVMLPFLRALGA